MGFLKIPDRNESQTQSKDPEKCIDFVLPMNPKRIWKEPQSVYRPFWAFFRKEKILSKGKLKLIHLQSKPQLLDNQRDNQRVMVDLLARIIFTDYWKAIHLSKYKIKITER